MSINLYARPSSKRIVFKGSYAIISVFAFLWFIVSRHFQTRNKFCNWCLGTESIQSKDALNKDDDNQVVQRMGRGALQSVTRV